MAEPRMLLNVLHLDDAFRSQHEFLAACNQHGATQVEAAPQAAPLRLWGKEKHIKALEDVLRARLSRGSIVNDVNPPVVTFMGSGDFHHVTALLLGLVAETDPSPITVIHFDNHPDWVRFRGGMHCGSWVNRALKLPQVERVITIGVCSRDLVYPQYKGANLSAVRNGKIHLLPWRSPGSRFRQLDIGAMGHDVFLQLLLSHIKTRNIYITVDKDVLTHEDAITNWDQGQMPLSFLLATLKSLFATHRVIGIDINGDYSPKRYGGRRHQVALKALESLIDQPRLNKRRRQALAVNEKTNLAILNCIREAA